MLSHEELGDSCDDCGNSLFMCACKRCVDCKFNWAAEDIDARGFCPDCRVDNAPQGVRLPVLLLLSLFFGGLASFQYEEIKSIHAIYEVRP